MRQRENQVARGMGYVFTNILIPTTHSIVSERTQVARGMRYVLRTHCFQTQLAQDFTWLDL